MPKNDSTVASEVYACNAATNAVQNWANAKSAGAPEDSIDVLRQTALAKIASLDASPLKPGKDEGDTLASFAALSHAVYAAGVLEQEIARADDGDSTPDAIQEWADKLEERAAALVNAWAVQATASEIATYLRDYANAWKAANTVESVGKVAEVNGENVSGAKAAKLAQVAAKLAGIKVWWPE